MCTCSDSCPFAFTDVSEYHQGLGCLPSPWDILRMREQHGKTWACHSDQTKPCAGALQYMHEEKIDCKIIDRELVTLDDDWEKLVYGI